MSVPCPKALADARQAFESAEASMRAGIAHLRDGGWDESADHLEKTLLQHARVVTKHEGFLWQLEQPSEAVRA